MSITSATAAASRQEAYDRQAAGQEDATASKKTRASDQAAATEAKTAVPKNARATPEEKYDQLQQREQQQQQTQRQLDEARRSGDQDQIDRLQNEARATGLDPARTLAQGTGNPTPTLAELADAQEAEQSAGMRDKTVAAISKGMDGLMTGMQQNGTRMSEWDQRNGMSSNLIGYGVNVVGEALDLVGGLGKAAGAAFNGSGDWARNAGSLMNGDSGFSKKDGAAAALSSVGKFAYGSVSGVGDLATRLLAPGAGHNSYDKHVNGFQQELTKGYESAMGKVGVDSKSKSYDTVEKGLDVASVLVPMPGSKAKGGSALSKLDNAVGAPNAGTASRLANSADNVKSLGQAVNEFKSGKIDSKQLNEALGNANDAYKQGGKADWDGQTRADFKQHSIDAHRAITNPKSAVPASASRVAPEQAGTSNPAADAVPAMSQPTPPANSTVGAMGSGFEPLPPDGFDRAIDLSHMSEAQAREHVKGQPETQTFKWNEPDDPHTTLLFRGEAPAGEPAGLSVAPTTPPASLRTVRLTDPLTGATLDVGPYGKIQLFQPNAPKNITASQRAMQEMPMPPESFERLGFQRNGVQFKVTAGYPVAGNVGAVANIWNQKDPRVVIDTGEIQRDAPRDPAGTVDGIARMLAERLPDSAGWSVAASAPASTFGANLLGVDTGSYLEVGNLQKSIDSGSVLYDPSAAEGSRYRLNTRMGEGGQPELVMPMEATVGVRNSVSPTSVPGIKQLLETTVGASLTFGRSSELKVPLKGAINPELLESINAGLNHPLAKQVWHDAGSVGTREVRQINYALPGTAPNVGSFILPEGWKSLERQLVPPDRSESWRWTTYTSGTVSFGGPAFGGASAGFRTQRVEVPPVDYRSTIRTAYDLPDATGELARPQSVSPFIFTATDAPRSSLVEVLPNDPAAERNNGEYVQSDVNGRLLVPGAPSPVSMPGSVLNALNGYAVQATDVPAINGFLRSLKPAGAGPAVIDQLVYEVSRRLQRGQPMDTAGRELIREAIRNYAAAPG